MLSYILHRFYGLIFDEQVFQNALDAFAKRGKTFRWYYIGNRYCKIWEDNLLKYRVITALILIPIVIAALFLLLPPAGFGLVIIAISGLAGWEWAQFIGWHSQGKTYCYWCWICCTLS